MKELTPQVTALLARIPCDDAPSAEQLGRDLAAGGSALVDQLAEHVGEPGDPAGVKPRCALHALAVYAARPGADAEHTAFAKALAAQLEEKSSKEVKAFFLEQLRLCGGPEQVPAIARCLQDERLCEPAAQALLSIRGQEALKALRDALPKAEKKRQATIRQAVSILSGK
jgi:hypothetical protein